MCPFRPMGKEIKDVQWVTSKESSCLGSNWPLFCPLYSWWAQSPNWGPPGEIKCFAVTVGVIQWDSWGCPVPPTPSHGSQEVDSALGLEAFPPPWLCHSFMATLCAHLLSPLLTIIDPLAIGEKSPPLRRKTSDIPNDVDSLHDSPSSACSREDPPSLPTSLWKDLSCTSGDLTVPAAVSVSGGSQTGIHDPPGFTEIKGQFWMAQGVFLQLLPPGPTPAAPWVSFCVPTEEPGTSSWSANYELGANSPELCEELVCEGQVCETHSDPGLPNNESLFPSGAASSVLPFTTVLARPPSSLGSNSDAQSPSFESRAPHSVSYSFLLKVASMEIFPSNPKGTLSTRPDLYHDFCHSSNEH